MATLTINGTAADDTIVVTATGADSGSYSINGGPAVAFSGVTQLAVTGGAGNDTLTIVNPTGGLFAPVNGISYDGGGQPADTLEILGGVATQLTYTAGATHDAGTLVHAGAAGTQTIDFAGIAPITDTVAAATLVIKGTAGNDAISVTDGGLVNGQQTTQVSAATFESIRFANKTTVTIDGNGGVDSVNFNNPTVAAGLTEMDVTNVGAVTQTGAVNYTNLSLNVGGSVDLNLNTNDVTNLAANVTGAGRFFRFHDADDIALTSVGGVNGISTTNGDIDIQTGNGAIIVANTAAAADVNAGTGDVTLEARSFGAADFAVQLSVGANVTGTGGVLLLGDNIDLADGDATVNAGTGIATLAGSTQGTMIELGGADGANTLGLTDTELDGISAGILRIGDSLSGRISIDFHIAPAHVNQLELVTAADIQDNYAGTDITVSRLAMNAGAGIGVTGASTGIETEVNRIEAATDTGGLNVSNAGAVTVGGVTANLAGVSVVDSGDLRLTAGGRIELIDTVRGGASSGNVFLTASGANADVISTEDIGAITAQAGNITVTAARDILFGTAVANQNSDVLANGSVTLSAGRSIILDGFADVISDNFGNDTGGGVTATAVSNIFVTGSDASIGAAGNAGADVTLTTTGGNGLVSVGALPVNPVFSSSGDVTINADRMLIAGVASIVGGQSVNLQPVSSDRSINLGSTNDAAAGTLELSDAELDSIFTPILRIGSTAITGNITVTSQIASDGDYATLSLRTGGGIVDGIAAPGTDVTVDNLALRAATGIGVSSAIFEIAVSNLAFENSGNGVVNIENASGLTLAAVDGLAASANAGGSAQVFADGALTIASNITASDLLNLGASETAAAGDNLTILAGATVRSTGSSIQIGAGDDLTAQAGSSIQSNLLLIAFVDSGSVDAGVGGTANLNGAVVVPSVTEIIGSVDNDTLNGTSLADILVGGAGTDIMRGGLGDDDYWVDTGGDAVIEAAGQGIDRVSAFTHFILPDNVENMTMMGVANLQGYGNGLANTIIGNEGSNLLDGRAGADSMKGGLGNDVYMVDNAGDTVTENAGEGNDTVYATAHFGLAANVENLLLQGSADLQGYGNALVNLLVGNTGNNLLNGNGGTDVMMGGLGNDAYFVDDGSDQVIENAGEGNDTVYATVHLGLSTNVENLILQGAADLQGYGNALVNALYGNSGNNILNGNGGADVMRGGAGNDAYFVDDGNDLVIENPGEGNDTVYTSVHLGLSANVENLILQGNANLQGYGNNLVNLLVGNTGGNLLNGNGGADVMMGGLGNDAYFVDDGFDQVIESAGEGNDTIYAGVHFILSANVENLVQQGSLDLGGTGNALVNGIFGNSGNNTLDGQGGADVLTGSAGNDTFVFNVGQGNGDTVVDFTGNGAAAGDSLRFVGYGAGASFTNVDATHWQVNYNAGTAHDVIAFMNGAAIDATDFMFV